MFREYYLHSDNKPAKSCLHNDIFACTTEVWYTFISNCQPCYKLNENITNSYFLHKQGVNFSNIKAKYKFKIKFKLAVDVQTKYLINVFCYLEKDKID